jgi:hypothetical protein
LGEVPGACVLGRGRVLLLRLHFAKARKHAEFATPTMPRLRWWTSCVCQDTETRSLSSPATSLPPTRCPPSTPGRAWSR